MSYIFVDESGDLGFDLSKEGTSRYFIITFLLVPTIEDKKRIDKIVKNTFSMLKKVHPTKKNCLHCNKESDLTRKRLLTKISNENIRVLAVLLDKRKVYTNLRNEKNILYNYVVNILLERLDSKKILPNNSKIILIASRRDTNKFLNINFKNYLEGTKSGHNIDIEVQIKTPFEEKSLQAVDFLSWSIFRKIEKENIEFYDIFKEKILEERWLYK